MIFYKSEGKEYWRFGWNYGLTMASTRKQTVRYKYDALGRRIQRYSSNGQEDTKFIYDGMDVVADDNFGTLTKYQNGLGIDNKLKLVTNGTSKYFLSDHLGSTNALTDSSGAILEQTAYDSFGNATTNLMKISILLPICLQFFLVFSLNCTIPDWFN